MKYDDASWHYGGSFPSELPIAAGATHTGMYVAWALLSGLAGDLHTHDVPENIPMLAGRAITPGAFFLAACNGKFVDEDLNAEGNAFTCEYFDFKKGQYLADYEPTVAAGFPELYYAHDSWENFDRLRPILDRRLAQWRSRRR